MFKRGLIKRCEKRQLLSSTRLQTQQELFKVSWNHHCTVFAFYTLWKTSICIREYKKWILGTNVYQTNIYIKKYNKKVKFCCCCCTRIWSWFCCECKWSLCFFITFSGLYSRIFISLYRFIFYERKLSSQLVCLRLFSSQLSFTSSKSLRLLVSLNILIGFFCISFGLFSYS